MLAGVGLEVVGDDGLLPDFLLAAQRAVQQTLHAPDAEAFLVVFD